MPGEVQPNSDSRRRWHGREPKVPTTGLLGNQRVGHLLICRHLARARDGAPEAERLRDVNEAARAIAECLRELPTGPGGEGDGARARPLWSFGAAGTDLTNETADALQAAGTDLTNETADALQRALTARKAVTHGPQLQDMPTCTPEAWSPYGGKDAKATLRNLAGRINATQDPQRPSVDSNALVLVLHDPHTQWLVRQLTGRSISLNYAGAVWLVPRRWHPTKRWAVWTTIDHEDPADLADLRAKIETKYKTAGVLGAFMTSLLVFLVGKYAERLGDAATTSEAGAHLPTPSELWLWRAALLAIAVGAALNFLALYEYDRLLMPKRFWVSRKPPKSPLKAGRVVARPPAGSAQLLVQGAQLVWARLVVTSGACLLVGLVALLAALTNQDHIAGRQSLLGVLGIAGTIGVWAWHRWTARPGLGASD